MHVDVAPSHCLAKARGAYEHKQLQDSPASLLKRKACADKAPCCCITETSGHMLSGHFPIALLNPLRVPYPLVLAALLKLYVCATQTGNTLNFLAFVARWPVFLGFTGLETQLLLGYHPRALHT